MKKIVYIIISVMALVLLVNVSVVSKESTILIESRQGLLEINPLY